MGRIMDGIRAIERMPGPRPPARNNFRTHEPDRWFWALIVKTGPTGQADFTDEKYWWKAARPKPTSGTDPLVVSQNLVEFEVEPATLPDGQPNPRAMHRAGTNLNEVAAHSHGIPENTVVRIHWFYDQAGGGFSSGFSSGFGGQSAETPRVRYVFAACGGGSSIIRVQVVDDYGHAQGIVSVRKVNASGVLTGDPFNVTIIHHTSTGDIFYAHGTDTQPAWMQLGPYPAVRSQFMVLQVMDATNGPQGIDWDFVKGHE